MIIVRTNKGDRFINEDETLQVIHNKEKANVEVWPSRWGDRQPQPQYYLIESVESVQYLYGKEIQWVDEGSEVKELKSTIESKDKEITMLLRRGRYLNHWLEIHKDAICKLKETAKKPKRNREKIMEQSLYDLLCDMNKWLIKNTACVCVMECFMQSHDAEERCIQDCDKCIADYLNEFPF